MATAAARHGEVWRGTITANTRVANVNPIPLVGHKAEVEERATHLPMRFVINWGSG